MTNKLQGKRIVNTRAVHQAAEFDDLITARGAVPLAYPCIAIHPPEDTTQLDDALSQLMAGAFDWLALTSANTVQSIAARLSALDLKMPHNPGFKVAAVGTSTAQAAQSQLGLQVDVLPDEFEAKALADVILSQGGGRVFLPQSAIAKPDLAHHLTNGGLQVTVIMAYQTGRGMGGVDLPRYLARGEVDIITFTSASTVRYFRERLHDESDERMSFEGICIACIGPKTAQTAEDHGFENILMPETYTLVALLDAIEGYYDL